MESKTNLAPNAPIFKKRTRPRAQRRRTRTSEGESDAEEERHAGGFVAIAGKEGVKKAWEKNHYAADGRKVEQAANATAERVDVGGEKAANGSQKKPFGPLRAPTHIRTSVRVDYQADVCKDYKETGYCGFGDSCKFLHDRSDFKAGWQLDRDWAQTETLRREKMLRGEDPDAVDGRTVAKDEDYDEDGLPFACHICRKDFKRPVATLCEHYFCEDCVLKRLKSDSTCAVCKKPLFGTLNPAPKLEAKLKVKAKLKTNE